VSRSARACVARESKREESRGVGGRCQARSPAHFRCLNVAGCIIDAQPSEELSKPVRKASKFFFAALCISFASANSTAGI